LPADLPALAILADNPLVDAVGGVAEVGGKLRMVRWREREQYPRFYGKPNIRALDLARNMLLLSIEYAEVELRSETLAPALKEYKEKELAEMKEMAKKIINEYLEITKRFENEQLRMLKLSDRVRSALKYDLVGEALKILTDKGTDLQKEYGQGIADIVLIRVALELAMGQLEDAALDLEYAPPVLESARLHANVRQYLQMQFQQMNIQKLILEGNYKEAGDYIGSLYGGHVGEGPPLAADESAFKKSKTFVDWGTNRMMQTFQLVPSNPIENLLRRNMINDALQPFLQRRAKLVNVRTTASDYYFARGLLSLYEGDIASAKERFKQSSQKGVPEWAVPDYKNPKAEHYLKLIEDAEDKATKSMTPR
jgi:hypothetical protein